MWKRTFPRCDYDLLCFLLSRKELADPILCDTDLRHGWSRGPAARFTTAVSLEMAYSVPTLDLSTDPRKGARMSSPLQVEHSEVSMQKRVSASDALVRRGLGVLESPGTLMHVRTAPLVHRPLFAPRRCAYATASTRCRTASSNVRSLPAGSPAFHARPYLSCRRRSSRRPLTCC
jgi:hypothetical protein